MNTDLLTALPALMVIGAGVGLVARIRDRSADDQHDLSDYHEPVLPEGAYGEIEVWEDVHIAEEMLPAGYEVLPPWTDDILPPAPAGMNAGCPLYAEALFASWRTETPAQTAARFLRELGDEAKTQPRELVPA